MNKIQESYAICRVVESKSELLQKGDFVRTYTGWVDFAVVAAKSVEKLPPNAKFPLWEHIASLGMVGKTAYFGVRKVFEPIKAGESAFVTGAAGAVGIYVCQILKQRGVHVVGCAGTDEKCQKLKSKFGCDVALNYKTTKITPEVLKNAFPNGIDMFFDNV